MGGGADLDGGQIGVVRCCGVLFDLHLSECNNSVQVLACIYTALSQY